MFEGKQLLVSLVIFSIVSFLTGDACLGGIDADGWKASPELVAKLSQRRSETNYDEQKVPEYTLPDPLLISDGTKVASAQAWKTKRRPEVLELFRTYVYGRAPVGRPKNMTFEVFDLEHYSSSSPRPRILLFEALHMGSQFFSQHSPSFGRLIIFV